MTRTTSLITMLYSSDNIKSHSRICKNKHNTENNSIGGNDDDDKKDGGDEDDDNDNHDY